MTESSATVESNAVTEETPVQPELPPLTEEEVAAQEALLEAGIARGMEWFEDGKEEADFLAMTEKEQTFTRLLDPLVWIMRESLISYKERSEGCEECTARVERRENGLALAVADMLVGPQSDG